MTDIKIDQEIPAPAEERFNFKPPPEQKTHLETIDLRVRGLTQTLQEEIIIAKDGGVFNPPEIEPFADSQKNQLISQLSPKLTDLTNLVSFWEKYGKIDRAYLQELQERLAKAQRLKQAGDTAGLFEWVLSEKYRFQEPLSATSKRLEELKWRLLM